MLFSYDLHDNLSPSIPPMRRFINETRLSIDKLINFYRVENL